MSTHRKYSNGYNVSFWKENSAVSCVNPVEPDRAVLGIGPPGMPYPQFEFSLPEQQDELDKLSIALDKLYQKGFFDCKVELRQWLGIVTR